ncbi:MAG TPA: hypothetical protein VFH45_03305, partial [Acidimicrobiales bacterium]|nr:hypothetical protein [Acidimicrobiales bacterium]
MPDRRKPAADVPRQSATPATPNPAAVIGDIRRILTAPGLSGSVARWGLVVVLVVIACIVAGGLLPNGLPFGVVLLGLVLGGLSSLTAMGLVIVYRSARIINFAQAEIG